jgi:hypothetical protein
MTTNFDTCLNFFNSQTEDPIRVRNFLHQLDDVLNRNDVSEARKIAQRVKNQLFTLNECTNPTSILTIPNLHQKIIDRLNQSDTPAGDVLRKELCSFYFQPLASNRMNWLSEQEMARRGASKCAQAFYYHATKLNHLEGILSQDQVTAKKEEDGFYGAFVAMEEPMFEYGPYALAFNKTIERQRPVSTYIGPSTKSIAFLFHIKTNIKNLNSIILTDKENFFLNQDITNQFGKDATMETHGAQFREWLSARCSAWAGREIMVLSASEARVHINNVKAMELGIPIEWGTGGYSDRYISENPPRIQSSFLPSRL